MAQSDNEDYPPIAPLPAHAQPPIPAPAPAPASTPPASGHVAEPPLTEKHWSLLAAAGFTALTALLTLGGGLGSATLARLPLVKALGADARGAIVGSVLIGSYMLLLGAVWLSARASGFSLAAAVGMRRVPIAPTLGVALVVAIGARMLTGLYAVVLQAAGFSLPVEDLDPTRLLPSTPLGVALTLGLACLIAPLVEEVVFRGILLSALHDRWGRTVAVLGSSAVFAALHVVPYSIPPIFVLALVLGRLFLTSRSLWTSIASHAVFNTIGIVAVYALKWAGVV